MKERYRNKYRSDSIRLKNYDYRSPGWYYVTICTDQRRHFFGEIKSHMMGLSQIGLIAHRFWQDIPNHFGHVVLDEFVIMPNHMHGLIGLKSNSDKTSRRDVKFNVSTNKRMSDISPKPGSLSTIIRSYKGSVTRWCNKNGFNDFAWQSKFYEHIVRDEKSLNRIRRYIYNNPIQWQQDDYYISS